ncbi:MAG TPA: ABC transporter ATP-binding protein [Ilumatobacter sp.]|nr:ABC transporter ATP-binding protein [Ilumatobacter sp.]
MADVEAATTDVLLSVRDLRTQFQTPQGIMRAVDGVSFDLAAGESLGVVGESGSGKSVLVRTIMNLLPRNATVPAPGKVIYKGSDVRSLSPTEAKHFWGTEMAMVFQDPMTALNPVKKIGEQLTESIRFHLKLSKKDAVERAVNLMRDVGIPEPARRLQQYPHELSGGMRQRVVIAIAIACEPRLLIADEPTTALDVTVQRQILDLLARLQDERQMAMILISHDLGVVSGMSDRVAVMYAGQFAELAPSQELFANVHHPYTEALLDSIPHLELSSGSRLRTISGRPPDMHNPPSGCRFAPRCAHAQAACDEARPALVTASNPEHAFRCFFPLRIDAGDVATPAVRPYDCARIAVGAAS